MRPGLKSTNFDKAKSAPPGIHFSSLEAETKTGFQGDEVTNTIENLVLCTENKCCKNGWWYKHQKDIESANKLLYNNY